MRLMNVATRMTRAGWLVSQDLGIFKCEVIGAHILYSKSTLRRWCIFVESNVFNSQVLASHGPAIGKFLEDKCFVLNHITDLILFTALRLWALGKIQLLNINESDQG